MYPDIRKILEAATMAPSGENAQPWKFIVRGNVIELFNLPHRNDSLYGWGQRASYMANGAVLENIVIAASQFGYNCHIEIFPNSREPELVAKIDLDKGMPIKDFLYDYIFERITNRKPYEIRPFSISEEKKFQSAIKIKETKIYFTQKEHHKKILGRVGSANEVIMLSNKHLHKYFFSHINWTKDEDDKKKIGFFIETLELPFPSKIGFKVIKHWPIAKILHKIGFHKMVGNQNAAVNSLTGGFGAITIPNNSRENFVLAGRTLQRIWLTATGLNLSMQPLTGILFFMHKVIAGETDKFTPIHVKIIKEAYKDIENAFDIKNNEVVSFMFRIGYGGKPSARSSRFLVDDVVDLK